MTNGKITAILKKVVKEELVAGGWTVREAAKIVKDSIKAGDPYEWGCGAAFISLESGLPGTYMGLTFWDKVSEQLPDGYYVEFINGGVAGLYN